MWQWEICAWTRNGTEGRNMQHWDLQFSIKMETTGRNLNAARVQKRAKKTADKWKREAQTMGQAFFTEKATKFLEQKSL